MIKQKFITSGLALSVAVCLLFQAGLSFAGAREQAKRMHDRIAGVPPSAAALASMLAIMDTNNDNITDSESAAVQAALQVAAEDPNFYTVSLKNWVTPWTNRDLTVFAPLNDFTATVIGIVRDEIDFRQTLYGNLIYVADPALNVTPYSNSNNNHYVALENQGFDLKASLVQRTQTQVTGLEADATAGVMTTRGGARAFFFAGTNRAMFRYTLMNFLCKDLEQVKDTTRVPDRIRQDISRSPGGDSRLFMNNCVGCHSGMDPLAQSFAYYEWNYDNQADPEGENGSLVYNSVGELDATTGTRVQRKYHINENNFKFGYVTPDDKWDNYWRQGQNQLLGWDNSLPGTGNGAKTMGQELAHSEQFARCQVEKVFENVCLREPGNAADRGQVDSTITSFKSNNYNLKRVFAETASYCKGN